jgi:two-component system LytT family sensor kinase
MKKHSVTARILAAIGLWLAMVVFFSMANNAFRPSDVVLHLLNSFLFTVSYYLCYHLLIRRLLYHRRTVRFVLFFILGIACLSAVSLVSVYEIYVFQGKKFFVDNYWSGPMFIMSNYLMMLMITTTLLSFRVLKDRMDTQTRLETLEKEKISTELGFLKAQINPHFLFNSLNNILFQIDKSNTSARETVLNFSAMLRYQLYDCSGEMVEIEKEIGYLRSYVEIQMLRKTDRYRCALHISDSVRHFHIAPLMLIPFMENAFKHVSHHAAKDNFIDISANYDEGQFVFTVRNSKDRTKALSISESGGIGLVNVRRRLDLLYPGKHRLEIANAETEFSISLYMNIDSLEYHEKAPLHSN